MFIYLDKLINLQIYFCLIHLLSCVGALNTYLLMKKLQKIKKYPTLFQSFYRAMDDLSMNIQIDKLNPILNISNCWTENVIFILCLAHSHNDLYDILLRL